MGETKQINVRLDEELLESLRTKAQEMSETFSCEISLSDVIRVALNKEVLRDDVKSEIDFEIEEDQYIPFSRKIFKPDYVGLNDKPVYKRGFSVVSYRIPQRGSVPDMIVQAEEISPEFFTLATNPTWKIVEDCPGRKESVRQKAVETLARNEDQHIVMLLEQVLGNQISDLSLSGSKDKGDETFIPQQSTWIHKDHFVGSFDIEDVKKGYKSATAKLKAHGVSCHNILIHPSVWERAEEYFDLEKDNLVVNDTSDFIPGKININQSYMVPKNTCYTLAGPGSLGMATIKIDNQELEADDPKQLRYGMVIFKYIALTLINDYCVAKFEIKD